MIRKADFSLSRRVYALNLKEAEKRIRLQTEVFSWYYIPAVWYKRKNVQGEIVTFAAYGEIRMLQDSGLSWKSLSELPHLSPLVEMLGRYDGKSFWGTEDLKRQKEIIALLEPMLKVVPSFPDDYVGWYNINAKAIKS